MRNFEKKVKNFDDFLHLGHEKREKQGKKGALLYRGIQEKKGGVFVKGDKEKNRKWKVLRHTRERGLGCGRDRK